MEKLKYKRVLLKLSGEALAAGQGFGVDPIRVHEIAEEIKDVHALGAEIAIVVGGGNFFRGVAGRARGSGRGFAEYKGRLGGRVEAVGMEKALGKKKGQTRRAAGT